MPLLPTSLIMRTNQCFYCESDSVNDERTLGHDFGIRHCASHESDAKRDSNAYLHVANQVRMNHALIHPVLGSFLSLLKMPVHIQRTSGIIEGGWVLQHEPWSVYTTLRSTNDSEWSVPMIHPTSEIMKYVPLSCFQQEGVKAMNSSVISEQIPLIQKILQDGLYKADYDSYCLEQTTAVVPETSNVIPVIMNGRVGRVYMPV